jgi:hypothetical protein
MITAMITALWVRGSRAIPAATASPTITVVGRLRLFGFSE